MSVDRLTKIGEIILKTVFFKAVAAALFAAFTSASFAQAPPAPTAPSKPLKVAYVFVSPVSDAGWTHQHDLARKELETTLAGKVTTSFVANVAEGADAERILRDLASQGNDLIFATSFGYMNPTEKVAAQFPNVKFMHATGYKTAANMANYNARFYEGRFLNGVIAGRMTKTNVVGYVAAFPIPEVLQGINAFTLGLRSTNPKAVVKVIWTSSWYDPTREREAASTLISQKADILTHHTDSTAVVQTAEEKGVMSFGYHSDMSKFGPKGHLTATTHHWGAHNISAAQKVIAGQWKTESIWGGMQQGFVKLAPFNPIIPNTVRDEVTKLQAAIIAGKLHPFTGPVLDQTGQIKVAKGAVMNDADLNSMKFYVQGVEGKLPTN
jgi:basic membrane protein A and related proteins